MTPTIIVACSTFVNNRFLPTSFHMLSLIRNYLQPSPAIPRLSDHEVKRLYPRLRLSILSSTFLGYAMFYLVRNNLSPVAGEIQNSLGYTKTMLGDVMAITAITYGIGKLLMGSVSDRSDVRKFMSLGLMATACCNFAFGASTHYHVHLVLWALNGFIQGMGWGPCGRSIGHWFSLRERGTTFAIWNISHNVGGGIAGILAAKVAGNWGWQAAFYVPGIIAAVGAVYLFFWLRDTPQSVGLPPIEEYKNDYPSNHSASGEHERELTNKELFVDNILLNGGLWLFAIANFFVYIVRYSMLDWGPLYLAEVKQANLSHGGWAVLLLEFGGIPSTLLIGWFSDRVGGRRGMVSLLCMIPILVAFTTILLNPPGRLWLDMAMLFVIGFFVYPPVMLLGVAALDLTSKKAVGAAAGFVGLFGYIGRTAQAKGFGWLCDYCSAHYGTKVGWESVLWSILACTVLAILFLSFTWRIRPRA